MLEIAIGYKENPYHLTPSTHRECAFYFLKGEKIVGENERASERVNDTYVKMDPPPKNQFLSLA